MRRWLLILLAVALLALGGLWWVRQEAYKGASVVAAAKRTPVTDPTAPSSRLIARSDLPPEGSRSVFDHLMAEAGGVPYPFEKLVAAVAKHDAQGRKPELLMIPDGRSLLKAQADASAPRVLYAPDFTVPNGPGGLGVALRGQLFLGFTPEAHEIEVISYNEAAGRFEFQLVQDYRPNGAKRLVYAKRAICESCHQGGGLIFSQRPWNETNGQPETAAVIAEAQRAHCKANPNCTAPAELHGAALSVPLAAPERFDELTDVGNFMAATQKLWLDACRTPACRRKALALALDYARAPGRFDPAGAEVAAYLSLLAPTVKVAVPESDIPNRDPIGEKKGIKGWWRTLRTPAVQRGEGAKTNEELEAFDKLPKLPLALDPLTPRAPKRLLTAKDPDGIYGLAAFFTPEDPVTLLQAASGQWPKVQAAVLGLPDSFFADAAVARVPVMQALLSVLGSADTTRQYPYWDASALAPPVASGEPPVALTAKSPLTPFAQYCFNCHRGNPSKRLNFMSGATEKDVAAHIADKSEIRDALDWPRYQGSDKASILMPPADSAERAALDKALKQDPKLLERMREQVPSLF